MPRAALAVLLIASLVSALAAGCSRPAAVHPRVPRPFDESTTLGPLPPPGVEPPPKAVPVVEKAIDLPEPSKQEHQAALLLQGIDFAAEHKYAAALELLERARQIEDSDDVRGQIDRVKDQRAEEEMAERMAQELGKLLQAGKAEEAARLASAALAQLGGSEAATVLLPFERAANAVVTAGTETAARRTALRQEGEAALRAQDLRGAALAFEQALQLGDDPALRPQLEAVHVRLRQHDQARERAAALRREPIDRAGILEALLEACRAWNYRQLREEIDTSRLALLRCRDRLAVADFEVRGDLGVPAAGRALAEELQASFRGRFDTVERERLGTALVELNVDANDLASRPQARLELVRRTGARFLVVGSVTPLGAVAARASLVEVRSGLVVQTAWLSAPTFAALLPRMETLSRLLMMTDAQIRAFDQQQARQAAPVALADTDLPSPPEPEAASAVPPPPLVTCTAQPVALGDLTLADFGLLPAVGAPPPSGPLFVSGSDPRARRLLAVALEHGDNLFRRGLCGAAFRRYELARGLAADTAAVAQRLDYCRPHLPPPRAVVGPTALPGPRPRLVVFPFLIASSAERDSPGTSAWAADSCAAYLGGDFEVVEPGLAAWYAARLGIRVRDVLLEPAARLCLAQALEARAFLFGSLVAADGLDASVHLVDAQTGAATGTGSLHVRDLDELKLRMAELAAQVLAPPAEQPALARAGKESAAAIAEVRRLLQVGHFAAAATVSRDVMARYPASTALQSLQEQADRQAQQSALENARRSQDRRLREEAAAARGAQQGLVQQMEAARGQAVQDLSEAERSERQVRWRRAAEALRTQGRRAREQGSSIQAVPLLQAAALLQADDGTFRALAQARAARTRTLRDRAAEEPARREAEQKRRSEASSRAVLEEQRHRQAEASARRQLDEDRARAALPPLLAQVPLLIEKQQSMAALAAALAARRLCPDSAEVERLVGQCEQLQAQVEAQRDKSAAAVERLAAARARHQQAESQARQRQAAYAAALKQARQALAEKKYDLAQVRFREAGKLYRTDEVLDGLQQTETLRTQEWARREADLRQRTEAIKRTTQVRALLAEGHRALESGHFDDAVQALREAAQLEPENLEVLTALGRAEQARTQGLPVAHPVSDPRDDTFRKLLTSGRQKLAAGNAEGAFSDLCEALKLRPGAPEAASLLGEARLARARSTAATEDPIQAQRRAEFQSLLQRGRQLLAAAHYEEAAQALARAGQLFPDNREVFDLLKQAQQGQTAQALEKVRHLLADVHRCQAGKDFDEARRLLAEAEKLLPGNAEVRKAREELTRARRARARSPEEKKKRRQEKFERALEDGQAALQVRNYEGALKAFAEALKLQPEDAQARALQAEAERLNREDQATYSAQVKRRADRDRLLARGRAALDAGKPAEAEKAFVEAQQLLPDDPEVRRALKEAREAQLPKKPAAAPGPAREGAILKAPQAVDSKDVPANAPAPYLRAMQAGADRAKEQKYAEAVQSYEEALRHLPGDARAAAALKTARCALHAAAGRKHHEAGRFTEAIAEYEAALQFAPDDKDIKDRLQRARARKP